MQLTWLVCLLSASTYLQQVQDTELPLDTDTEACCRCIGIFNIAIIYAHIILGGAPAASCSCVLLACLSGS